MGNRREGRLNVEEDEEEKDEEEEEEEEEWNLEM